MTFEGQEKPGQHAKQRRKVKTGKDRAKEGGAKLSGGGGVYPTLKGGTAAKSTPLACKTLCVSCRVFRMCGRDLMC